MKKVPMKYPSTEGEGAQVPCSTFQGLVAPRTKTSSAGLGVLMLLRRRMPLIICSDACEACWGCWGKLGLFLRLFVRDWKLRFSQR